MEKLRAAIVKHIEEHDISIRALAKMCDISEGSVRNILKGRVQNPRADVLDRICRACGTSVDAILASQHRAELVIPDCVTPDAKCVTLPEKRVASDAKSPIKPDKNDVNTSDSKNVYSSGRLFPDEGGDDILRMCHTLANTGHAFGGDLSDIQFRHAMEEDAENEVRRAQERLAAAIAAREKLKGDKHGQN